MSRKSEYDKVMDKEIKDFEKFIHRINKKTWTDKGLTPPWVKDKRKKKKISDVSMSLDSVHKKLDRMLNENSKLKEEIKDIKEKQIRQIELKTMHKPERPKSIMELQREGGNIIDPVAYAENVRLKEKLKKKETCQ